MVRGCSGVGLLEALSANGMTNAADAMSAAAGADKAPDLLLVVIVGMIR